MKQYIITTTVICILSLLFEDCKVADEVFKGTKKVDLDGNVNSK